MIIVYGGCEADATAQTTPRLPPHAAEDLFVRIRGLLQSLEPTCLVGALASGADILFARAALAEGIPLHALLPIDAASFRETRVAPHGEPWVSDYDRITDTVDVRVAAAHADVEPTDLHRKHNVALLDEATTHARREGQRVWLLTVRPQPDRSAPTATDDLVHRAEERGMLTIDFDPLPASPGTAFMVMPYGKKKDPRVNRFVECDPAFHRVYRPLLEDFDLKWTRADLQTDCGIIHSAMLSDLANSNLVVADLSAINFNVAYELGIRHVFASRATVLVDPTITSFRKAPPPFDINLLRAHTFFRGPDGVTDEQAEAAIRELSPVVATALETGQSDSPCHQWFDLEHVLRPFRPRAAVPQYRRAGRAVRDRVTAAIRSSDREVMRAEAANLESEDAISDPARQACRIELAAGLLNERAYTDAQALLELARPEPGDPLHQIWLHKTVMTYRRLGENAEDPVEQRRLWDVAKRYLAEAEEAGYRDSETYGIWGGLLKRQLERQRAGMDEAVAQRLFAEMEQKYRLGFELDPEYYTGVNVVMALRWSGSRKDEAFARDFDELLIVSRFLARTALTADPGDFWAAVTLAELTLHEGLEHQRAASIEEAVQRYADAARKGRPDQIDSAAFQLSFLRTCGDPPDVIDRAIIALMQAD